MRKVLKLGAFVLSVMVLFVGMAGKGDEPFYKDGQKIKVSGVLRMVGNEPFTRLVIRVNVEDTTNRMDIYLPDELKKTNQVPVASQVEAEGEFHMETIYSANHKYKIREYHLSNVVSLKKIEPPQE